MNANSILDLDAYLDATLDDIPDLPSFLTVPNGAHLVTLKAPNIDKETGGISINGVYRTTLELENAEDESKLPTGEGFIGETFRPGKDNPKAGLSRIKMLFKDIAEANGWATVRDVLDNLEGRDVVFVTKQRAYADKNTGEQRIAVGVKSVIDPDTFAALKAAQAEQSGNEAAPA